MSPIRRVSLVLSVLTLLMPSVRAQVPGTAGLALSSPNVEFVANIPVVGAVGAEIIGDLMYVTGATGLTIFDLSFGIPVPIGELAIPNFANEDVDTNGDILLISSDYSLGLRKILFVIDVSNPTV